MLIFLSFVAGVVALGLCSPLQTQEPFKANANADIPFGVGWVDPRINGGRLLDVRCTRSSSSGGSLRLTTYRYRYWKIVSKKYGEPLNVIISGRSDPYILTDEGFLEYTKSIGFSSECLGLHYGHIHEANLGDGNGRTKEQLLARQHYFPVWGTCWESLAGGNHFRAWKQNGTWANTGAWFLAASKEKSSSKNHMIIPDGYNIGRDYLVSQATTPPGTRWKGKWWLAKVDWHDGLIEAGKEGA
ncbi:hypothetical protein PQX77_016057 [Marasmius sp. AFHP31]|nr:hypothetical protein PQX77_016057 [Marasmius sp. AFHP31]